MSITMPPPDIDQKNYRVILGSLVGVMAVFMPLSSTRGAPRDRALKAAGVVPEYIDLAMI